MEKNELVKKILLARRALANENPGESWNQLYLTEEDYNLAIQELEKDFVYYILLLKGKHENK